jgi:hypothetical protein
MKYVLFLMLIAMPVLAEIGVIINSSADNIPTSFAEGDAGSEAIVCQRGEFSIKTDADIYWALGKADAAPTTATSNSPIDAGDAYVGKIVSPNQTIYIRSATGSVLSSGKVYITCEGVL